MIGELIQNYGEIGALGVLVLMMAWYLYNQSKHQNKREDKHDEERIKRENKRDEEQKEVMLFYRDLVKTDLKDLHQDSLLNVKLNRRSIETQKILVSQFTALAEYLNSHFNGCVDKVNFKKKIISRKK